MLSLLLRIHMCVSCRAGYILQHVQQLLLIAVGNGVEVDEKSKDERSDGGKEEEIQGNQNPPIQYLKTNTRLSEVFIPCGKPQK